MYDEECVAYAQQLSSQIILPHKTKRKNNRRKEKIDEHKKSKQSLSESARYEQSVVRRTYGVDESEA